MVFIPTVVYILTVVSSLSDYSPQHSPHSYQPSARMRERVTVVTLSVSQSESGLSVCHFFVLEKAPFSGLKLTSVHSI